MISHLALSPHPTSWLSDVMHLLTAAFPQVPRAAARWRARRHDVTTLPALADYHERPRRTLTTRRAGDRTGMLAESHSLGETAGRRLSVASRGSYDKVGYVGIGRTVWSAMAYHPWVTLGSDAPAPYAPPPPAAHQLGRADKNETVTREGIGITFL